MQTFEKTEVPDYTEESRGEEESDADGKSCILLCNSFFLKLVNGFNQLDL